MKHTNKTENPCLEIDASLAFALLDAIECKLQDGTPFDYGAFIEFCKSTYPHLVVATLLEFFRED